MFYSCCIVYCLQSEEKRLPFEHQLRQPIMEVCSICVAVCLRVNLLWLVFQRNKELSFPQQELGRLEAGGGSVTISPNWLTLSLHERWRWLSTGRRRRAGKERDEGGVKVDGEVVKKLFKACSLRCAHHKLCSVEVFSGENAIQQDAIFTVDGSSGRGKP